MKNDFPSSLRAVSICRTRVPNCIALSPINTSFGDNRGNVTKRLIEFHAAIAHGQVGLSIVGSTAVSKDGRVNYYGLLLDSEDKIANFRMLFEAIEKEGSLPAIQLMHAGRQTYPEVTESSVIAPSNIASTNFGVVPKRLKTNEIRSIVEKFADAAFRAKSAGAKLVELHGAHGYLIEQFLSPFSNNRDDEYGGNLKNRARFFCEIIKATKRKLGSDFPVICRIGVDDYAEGGICQNEYFKIAKYLVLSGADCISISAGIYGQKDKVYPTTLRNQKIRFQAASELKKMFKIPIICGGKVANLFEVEGMLESKKADVVGMARALIADPHLVKKSINHDAKSVVACNWCNECTYNFRKHERLRCSVNPYL